MFIAQNSAYKLAEEFARKEMKKKQAREGIKNPKEGDDKTIRSRDNTSRTGSRCSSSTNSVSNKTTRKQPKWTPPPPKNKKKAASSAASVTSSPEMDAQTISGDETSVASSITYLNLDNSKAHQDPAVLAEMIERKVESLLAGIRSAIGTLTNQEKDLIATLASHWSRAKARYTDKNKLGAVISMKHVKKAQHQLSKVMEATDYLQTQEMDLMTKTREAQTLASLHEEEEDWWQELDWKHHAARVREIMDEDKEGSAPTSDDELLEELAQAILEETE